MKIICIARNYIDHISELSNKKPKELLFFLKPDTSLLLNNKPFFFPTFSNEIDHEVEILVKINKVVYQMESSTLDFLDLLNEPAE